MSDITQYIQNCFLLVFPVLVWNSKFTKSLPPEYQTEIFSKDIPGFITIGEHFFRILVFFSTLLMPLHINSNLQRAGFLLYAAGLMFYFISWVVQMRLPDSPWSKSIFGFLAPAYTALIWLTGIGLIGNELYVNVPYHRIYFIAASFIFIIFHMSHAFIVYKRLQKA